MHDQAIRSVELRRAKAAELQINGGLVMVQDMYWQLGVGIQFAMHVGADWDALD